ncbi:MAG: hypothetical protein SGI88_11925 [Candidatus Hydrogenedentes bacterium]|nr:hypothetical protein [Candidatus Hydrogenedentota bacterium]
MTETERHLDLLAIFHYIFGGVMAFFACFPLIHVAMGLAMIFGAVDVDGAPSEVIGGFFAIIGGFIVLCGWALAVAIIIAGRKLKSRTSRMYCIVIAALECMMMPFGTILGVFTLVVLTKDQAIQLYAADAPLLDINHRG